MRFGVTGLFAAALATSVAACENMVDVHGNAPPPDRLEIIKVGVFTRDDVMALLGSPSSTSLFGDDSWFYISNRFETWAFTRPEEVERKVVAIDFDRSGYVQEVRSLTLSDGKEVVMVDRVTPTAGHDLGVLEQLLGNVGRFSGRGGDSATGQ